MKIFLVLYFCMTSSAWAKLAPTSFSSFIKDSEIIIYATPMKANWAEHDRGTVDLRVNKVLRGEYKEATISISWGDEVHDQRIDNMGVDWILFLKKDHQTGAYTGTHYGRSYWPLVTRAISSERASLDWDGTGAFYQYPLSMLTFNKDQKSKLISKNKHHCNSNADFIQAKALLKYLELSK